MRKIILPVLEYDERTLKLFKEMGFDEEARFKEDFYRKGKYHDIIYLTLFNKDFWEIFFH